MSAQTSLAVRPRPWPGESSTGFLVRVAAANGFGSVRQLQSRMRAAAGSTFEQLCQQLLLTSKERMALFGILSASWDGPAPPMGLAPADFNHTRRRWCPACLAEGGFLQGVWGLKLVGTCARHGTWLHDLCARCEQPLDWHDVDLLRCPCGATLGNASLEPADPRVVALCKALAADDGDRQGLLASAAINPAALHRATRYLGLFSIDSVPERPGQIGDLHRQDAARALLVGMVQLIDDWPHGFHAVLAAMQERSTATPSVQRTFAPLYRVLYVELAGAAFQPFRDAFEAYLQERWWGLVCRRNTRLLPGTRDGHPRLTAAQAARASSLPAAAVYHLIQAELLPATSAPLPSGRTNTTLHARDIAHLRSATTGALCLSELAGFVALPERRLRQLIAAGVIQPLLRPRRGGPGRWMVPAAEAARLTVRSAAAGVPLRFMLKCWHLTETESVALVVSVMESRPADVGPTPEMVGIGNALLDPQQVRNWIRELRGQTAPSLSVDEAAKRLGIKQEVAYELVRRGLMRADADDNGHRKIYPADLQAFTAQYISLAEYARVIGRAPRYALSDIRARPVCGPSVDGARQYFFNRAELMGSPPQLSPPPGGSSCQSHRPAAPQRP